MESLSITLRQRQTSDLSREILKITAQNNSDLWTKICVKQLNNLFVEIMNSEQQVEGET